MRRVLTPDERAVLPPVYDALADATAALPPTSPWRAELENIAALVAIALRETPERGAT